MSEQKDVSGGDFDPLDARDIWFGLSSRKRNALSAHLLRKYGLESAENVGSRYGLDEWLTRDAKREAGRKAVINVELEDYLGYPRNRANWWQPLSGSKSWGSFFQNPLLAAAVELEQETAKDLTREIVVQSTLAYIGSSEIGYATDRYLPVDIHLPEWNPKEAAKINAALELFCEGIGCEYIAYPALAKSSTNGRGVIRTSPQTQKQFDRFEATVIGVFEDEELIRKVLEGDDDAALKVRAEILNLNSQTKKNDAETRKIEVDIEQAPEESAKKRAETQKTKAETFNAFATGIAKIVLALSLGASVIIGGTRLSSGNSGDNGSQTTVTTSKVSKKEHANRLEEFLKKLVELEEIVLKTTGE